MENFGFLSQQNAINKIIVKKRRNKENNKNHFMQNPEKKKTRKKLLCAKSCEWNKKKNHHTYSFARVSNCHWILMCVYYKCSGVVHRCISNGSVSTTSATATFQKYSETILFCDGFVVVVVAIFFSYSRCCCCCCCLVIFIRMSLKVCHMYIWYVYCCCFALLPLLLHICARNAYIILIICKCVCWFFIYRKNLAQQRWFYWCWLLSDFFLFLHSRFICS